MTDDPRISNEASPAEKTLELLRINEELEWAAALAAGRERFGRGSEMPEGFRFLRSMPPQAPGETSRDVLRRFVNVFAEEIAAVKAARDRAVHALDLDGRSLESALSVGRRLENILHQSAHLSASRPN